jgi:hypothetical protein
MSVTYGNLALKNLWFADLENMFRLQECFKGVKFKGAISASRTDLNQVFGLTLQSGNDFHPLSQV